MILFLLFLYPWHYFLLILDIFVPYVLLNSFILTHFLLLFVSNLQILELIVVGPGTNELLKLEKVVNFKKDFALFSCIRTWGVITIKRRLACWWRRWKSFCKRIYLLLYLCEHFHTAVHLNSKMNVLFLKLVKNLVLLLHYQSF